MDILLEYMEFTTKSLITEDTVLIIAISPQLIIDKYSYISSYMELRTPVKKVFYKIENKNIGVQNLCKTYKWK